MGLQVLLAIALGEQPEKLARAAADLGSAGAMARFGRDDEREADAYGVRFTIAAGYDPRGLIRLFESLQALERRPGGSFDQLLASHPATTERIERIERQIAKAGQDLPRRRHGQRYRDMMASLHR
jgi:predicted Zn-dependent protease